MKKQNGITLIALVISIIVMLILAGVSINAVVGDNGMISKAQDTVFLNSCAYLEEYFNQLYATCAIDGVEEGDTPLHTIMKSGYQNYFFSTSEGACLKKVVINEETGTNQTIVLYLVKKEQLPEEIRAQLTGAEDLESRDYRKLRGCYGITSDLKAYYCEDGLDTILGLTKDDLNADSPDVIFADENSVLANVVNGGTAPVTNQGLKTIKRLTIDSTEELSLLAEFSRFINLTEVYFSGIEIPSLSGIEGAANSINYVKFTNCNVQDYSAMNGLTNLSQLYLVKPAGKDEEIVRFGSTDKGIASAEFSKLQYFGIVGNEDYLNSSTTTYSGVRYGITDISSLSNFTDVTKKAIKYMNLQNLQLTSIAALEGFTNIYLMRLEENALTTFEGIQNMNSLKYLIAPVQYSNTSSSYTLGMNEGDLQSETDALKYIYKNNNSNSILYYVDLRNNSNIKYVDSLGECTGIKFLYMSGCTNIQNVSSIATSISNCGGNYSISGEYGLEIISDTTTVLSLEGKRMTISEFEQLKNKTKLTHLNLANIIITDSAGNPLTASTTPTFNDEVNSVLATCINLKYLKLSGLTNLTTIDFINNGKCTKLVELDLDKAGVTDLTNLNAYAINLKTLVISNENIILKSITTVIDRMRSTDRYWNPDQYGLCTTTWNLFKQLEDCTDLTYLRVRWCSTAGITSGKTLDLSNTKLTYYSAVQHRCIITFPNTLTYCYLDDCATPIFSEGSDSLTEIHFLYNRTVSNSIQWENFIKSIANVSNLQTLSLLHGKYFDFSTLEYLSNLTKLNKFVYTGKDAYDANRNSISGVEYLKNLTTLELYNLSSLIDISEIKELTKLTTLYVQNCKISDISSIGNLKELTYLNLNNNSISDIYPLMNCTKLETLYIRNNTLNDFSYYKDSTGRSIGYEVMDVFYDLNHEKQGALKNLYISGNTFDDTGILLDLEWSGQDGF